MTKIKSLLHKLVGLYLIGWFTTFALVSTAFAGGWAGGGSTDAGFWINETSSDGVKGIAGAGTDTGDGILDVIKRFVNYALGLLALIAFVMLLWGGYKMVTSGGEEEAYKEGLKILKNAAIGIAFISVSWFLVTFIFYVIGIITN
jgi:hypothetical protein